MKVRPLEGGLESWRKLGFPMQGSGAAVVVPAERVPEATSD